MKNFSSYKVAIVVATILLSVWGGWSLYVKLRLSGFDLTTISPGEVNLVAISPQAGYKIIVANEVAYLAEVDIDADTGAMAPGAESVANAPRLPLKELLQTLQGDEKALAVFIERLNKWGNNEIISDAPVWRAEDIQLALDGDQEQLDKLTADLNVDLEGLPLNTISTDAIRSGIMIESPVTITLQIGDEVRDMTARIQEIYRPMFCRMVENELNKEFDWTDEVVRGNYIAQARPIIEAGSGEDVRRSLSTRIKKDRLQELTVQPLKVLNKTQVLINEDFITAVSFVTYDAGQGHEFSDVTIELTEEGRMRLWKYSHENPGFQLLFINQTIAIAAPRIETDLAEHSVTIRRIPNKYLVQEAVDTINRKIKDRK